MSCAPAASLRVAGDPPVTLLSLLNKRDAATPYDSGTSRPRELNPPCAAAFSASMSLAEGLDVACHEHGTALSGFCQLHGTTLVASHGTARRALPVVPFVCSLTARVMFTDVEVVEGGIQGGQRG